MKFREIPRFIRCSGYQINVSLKVLDRTIQEYIDDHGLELNPDFQRGHVWTEEQQIGYVEFLLKGGKSDIEVFFNHPRWSSGLSGDFVCVDGLQRITACLRFVRNEIQAFGQYYKEFGDEPDILTCLVININELQTRREVIQWYLEKNTGGTVHTPEELDRVRQLLETKYAS